MNAVSPNVIVERPNRPGWVIQLLWFVFIGWWFGMIWTGVAWFLMNTYVLLPVGVLMLHYVPQVMALRGKRYVETATGRETAPQQINLLVRIIYFFALGWWLSGVWLTIAYICCATIILMPVGFKMFDLTPMVVSLRQ
jgi:uncharacterized membrane protein YccF (DUF307 family)